MTASPAPLTLVAEFPYEAPLSSCALDGSGRFLLAGGRDRKVLAVELETKKAHRLEGHETWIGAIVRGGDGLVLSADYAGRVVAWDCTGKLPTRRWSVDAHPGTIYGLAVSADAERFVTGDRDGAVRVADMRDGRAIAELPRIEYPVYGVALTPDGRHVIAADRRPQKPRILVRDVATGAERLVIEVPELSGYRRVEDIEWGGIRGLTLSSDGRRIVACGRNGYDGAACALVYDGASGKLEQKLLAGLKGGFCYGARFDPQGGLWTACGDIGKGEIGVWDVEKGTSSATIGVSGPAMGLDLDPSGRKLVVAQAIGKQSYPESGLAALYERTGG